MERIILKATEKTKILKQILGSHQDYGWALIYGGFCKHLATDTQGIGRWACYG